MKNMLGTILLVLLAASTVCLAADSAPPPVAIITGEVRKPTSREITFRYDSQQVLGKPAEQRVRLDSRDRFASPIA